MNWFQRQTKGILTNLSEQNDVPQGQWIKCPGCGSILNRRELEENLLVCSKCAHHFNMTGLGYLGMIYDEGRYDLFDEDLKPVDALEFTDRKPYKGRLLDAQRKSGLEDAIRSAMGTVDGMPLSTAVMEFSFIGGSMGSVVGEVVARAIRRACDEKAALLIISQSGGARMMEGALSLMQMAKTSANLARTFRSRPSLYLAHDEPDDGGRHGLLRHAGRL